MNETPFFSVVMPTYGRGRHITPTVESVLAQSFGDFELIVVGDGCTDETEQAVRMFPDDRVKWLNLPENTGSQSSPNNEGIRASRGHWIAYIGHDDIWAPDHLDRMVNTITSAEGLDFVASGCIFYGPKGSDDDYVTGLFDTPDAPYKHFFPPTSIAHRRDVTARMGNWRNPHTLKCPLDNEFLLRAAHAGLKFASTSVITSHKFAAGNRYLSYLRVSSDEQREFLSILRKSGIDVIEILRKAKMEDRYMIFQYGDYSMHPEGYLFEQNKKRKGISRPALQLLKQCVVMEQTDEPRGSDWHELESNGKLYRWSGPSPKPKILIPYSGAAARISLEIVLQNPTVPMDKLTLEVEGRPVDLKIETNEAGISHLVSDIALRPADYTVLTINAPTHRPAEMGLGDDRRKLGVAIGDILVDPIQTC
jgi:glycosyltransferase involved in cell wall biosynthesis